MSVTEKNLVDKAPNPEDLRRKNRWISATTIAVILLVWIAVTELKLVRPLFLPPPQDLWASMLKLGPNLPYDIFASLILRIIPGFLIGSLVGAFIGVLMAMNRVGRAIISPIVEVLRPLPPLALIPLLILWLGIGNSTQILLIAYGSFIILVVNSFEAVRNVPPIYIHAATTLGATSRQIFRRVIIPAIIPDIFGAVRVSAAASFGYCVAAELLGASSGLGYRLILARRYLATDNIIVILIVIAILSFALDAAFRSLNNRATAWKSRLDR